MKSTNAKRLRELEEQIGETEEERERKVHKAFLARLTDAQLDWLLAPTLEAQRRVPCPHVESLSCDCRSAERATRGFEAFPELGEEYMRRRKSLEAQIDEIMQREPQRMGATKNIERR